MSMVTRLLTNYQLENLSRQQIRELERKQLRAQKRYGDLPIKQTCPSHSTTTASPTTATLDFLKPLKMLLDTRNYCKNTSRLTVITTVVTAPPSWLIS